jgi:hypothetical protein
MARSVGFWLFLVGGLQGKFGQWGEVEGERMFNNSAPGR